MIGNAIFFMIYFTPHITHSTDLKTHAYLIGQFHHIVLPLISRPRYSNPQLLSQRRGILVEDRGGSHGRAVVDAAPGRGRGGERGRVQAAVRGGRGRELVREQLKVLNVQFLKNKKDDDRERVYIFGGARARW